ncbi:MAG: hypothetical protein ACP5TY_02175 [Thermodesulforhabdaceae bacterium]|jgi:hypothetical protein
MSETHEKSSTREQIVEHSGIMVDEEGNWTYQGNPIIREDIIRLFYEHLRFIPENGYVIEWEGAFHPVSVADTPFVVTRVDADENEQGVQSLWITLKHFPERELLDPSTLFIGKNNVLYCKIHGGDFIARFSRPAYYQIAQMIEEENGAFVIKVGGKTYEIREKPSFAS